VHRVDRVATVCVRACVCVQEAVNRRTSLLLQLLTSVSRESESATIIAKVALACRRLLEVQSGCV
jgi:hypothetical protein